jgi:hypothetical protein
VSNSGGAIGQLADHTIHCDDLRPIAEFWASLPGMGITEQSTPY